MTFLYQKSRCLIEAFSLHLKHLLLFLPTTMYEGSKNMVNDQFTEEQARSYMEEILPQLDYWKRYEELSDDGQFEAFKQQL